MLLAFGILALVVAWLLHDPSRGWFGTIFFGIVGVVLVLFGLHDD